MSGAGDLEAVLRRLRDALRDWPQGVRWGNVPATVEDCLRLRGEARAARALPGAEAQAEFLDRAEARLNTAIGDLRSDEGKCFF